MEKQNKITDRQFLGTWKLKVCDGRCSDGTVFYPFGENPEGMLMYGADGHMMVMLMKPGRSKFSSNDSFQGLPEQVKEAFEGFEAYGGTYTLNLNEGTVTHHLEVCRFPNQEGIRQTRSFAFKENILELTTPPMLVGGKEWIFRLEWEGTAK